MQDVRWAIAGCGLFAESHPQGLRAVPGARVAAVYDVNRSRAEGLARDFDVSVVCDSLEQLCAYPDADVVDVVTPENSHAKPAVETVYFIGTDSGRGRAARRA